MTFLHVKISSVCSLKLTFWDFLKANLPQVKPPLLAGWCPSLGFVVGAHLWAVFHAPSFQQKSPRCTVHFRQTVTSSVIMHPTETGTVEYFEPKQRACWVKCSFFLLFFFVSFFFLIKEISPSLHRTWSSLQFGGIISYLHMGKIGSFQKDTL